MKEEKQADVSKPETFEDYMRNARDEFVLKVTRYFPHEFKPKSEDAAQVWTDIRVAAEDLLICFDQMREKLLAGYAAANQPQKEGMWLKASDNLKSLPLEEFIHAKNNVGSKFLGNFFKDERRISFSVCGTSMYESYVIPQEHFDKLYFLSESKAEEAAANQPPFPTDKETQNYANGNFGFEPYAYEKEHAFISGVDWTIAYIKDKLAAANQPQPHESIEDTKDFIHKGIEFANKLRTESGAYKAGAGYGYSCGYKAAAAAKDGQAERMFSLNDYEKAVEQIGSFQKLLEEQEKYINELESGAAG